MLRIDAQTGSVGTPISSSEPESGPFSLSALAESPPNIVSSFFKYHEFRGMHFLSK